MFDTVLFPFDGSREAREASQLVTQIVDRDRAKLIVLSVIDPESGETDSTDAGTLLAEAETLFGGIAIETIQRTGKPAFTICDVADELNVKLIVMGSRGIGIDTDRVTESVTNRVINLAPCPVLVVP
jgi:nucleotide-binding universal stress UspA family protein